MKKYKCPKCGKLNISCFRKCEHVHSSYDESEELVDYCVEMDKCHCIIEGEEFALDMPAEEYIKTLLVEGDEICKETDL